MLRKSTTTKPVKSKSIFLDPSRRRWRKFVVGASIVFLCISILIATIAIRIYTDPDFQSFNLGTPSQRYVAGTVETSSSAGTPLQELRRNAPLSVVTNGLDAFVSFLFPSAQAAEVRFDLAPEIFAFYVNWDPASENSLREHIDTIDVLLPEWLHLADGNGAIVPNDALRMRETLELIEAKDTTIKIAPLLNNFSNGKREIVWINELLENPAAMSGLVANTLDFVLTEEFSGITIDLKGMREENRDAFYVLAEEFYTEFKRHGLVVYHTLPISAASDEVSNTAKYAEAIVLLALGEHHPGSNPGPLASQAWFEEHLLQRFLDVPAAKLIVGLANYAFDWQEDMSVAEMYSVQEAFSRAREAGADYKLDAASLNPKFSYFSEDNSLHSVWLLDSVTSFNQLQRAMPFQPHGIALWRLGSEDPGVWKLLIDPQHISPDILRTINYTHQIDHYGKGEIRQLTNLPKDGHRQLELSKQSTLITSAKIEQFPRGFEIMQWGAQEEKLLALTFDDGPDAQWTPKILEILAKHDVQATFFVTGINMLKNSGIVQRMLDDGHEIGNHTYSHINVSTVGNEVLRLELNATQRIFESISGRNLVMFRPPYAQDSNPQSPEEIRPLATISEMGYFAVNMSIYARDWWLSDANQIVKWIDDAAHAGDGNIVLLHDGGGDRSQTVAALDTIIEHLRSEGFRFVTVSGLIGKTKDEVMPQMKQEGPVVHFLQSAGFFLVQLTDRWAFLIFLGTIILSISRSAGVLILALIRGKRHTPPCQAGLTVGVVVPAFNEEKVILKTVRSLLASKYPNLKILIVDDGSTDRTFNICKMAFAGNRQIAVVTQKNSGKSEALNLGFRMLDTDIVVALDADTLFLPDTISKLVRNFYRKEVAAVSGNAKVGNRINLLTKWQALEYITAQNIDRRAAEYLNCIPVVPGAVGAWRREVVLQAGGFTLDTLAEDADLTFRLIRDGHLVIYDEYAIALTEAPETVSQFMKQRFRWMYGMMQVAFKHLSALRLKDSKSVGLVSVPNVLIFQILFPLLAPIIDLVALIALTLIAWNFISDASYVNYAEPLLALSMFIIFILIDFLSAIAAFSFEKNEDRKLLFWLIPQRFFYRQLIYIVALKAVFAAIRGSVVGWGNLKRTANVQAKIPLMRD